MRTIYSTSSKSTSAPYSRRSLLRGSSVGLALAASAMAASPGKAADECGVATTGTVTCTAAGNPYPGGITYLPAGDLGLTTNADVTATNTINVSGGGTTTITNNGSIATTGDGTAFTRGATGIVAVGTTGVVVTGNGAISTSGLNARGIDATATGAGPVTINVGDITTTGVAGGGPGFFPNSSAIFANTDTGAITVVAGKLLTAGDSAGGVQAGSNKGPITVSTGSVTTTGNNANGIVAQSDGTGPVVITSTGTVMTSGQGANGLYAVARNGTATVNANTVNTTGFAANGIAIQGGLGANATFGTVSSNSTFGKGVTAFATGDVVVSGANVNTQSVANAGIYAYSTAGNATVSTTGAVTTAGASSRGIYAYATAGTATVNAVNVTTTANDSQAIVATGANAIVVSTGTVSTAGTKAYSSNGDAITVTGTAGNATATVNNVSAAGGASTTGGTPVTPRALVVTATGLATGNINGAVNATNGDAVVLTGATTMATVATGGSIAGGVNGIVLNGTTGSALTNAGTITSGATGAAVVALVGPATVTNSGRITGRVTLSGGNDTLTNTGTFNATGGSDFGAGTDTVNNSGRFNVLPTATTAGAVTLTGLETFNNSGTVSLVNGHAGDTLTLPGTFTGSGASTLGVDIAPGGAGSSDRLIVNGAATGSTLVTLNNVTSANSGVNSGLVFATGGAGTSATAFSLATQSQNIGFVNYSVGTSTAAGVTSFALVGTPGDSLFRALKINEAAQNVWYKSADAWSAHMSELRDSKWAAGPENAVAGGRVWGIMYGGVQTRKDTNRNFTAFGVTRTVDTGYKQDAFGGQIGLDLGGASGDSAFVFGVTGGYANSELSFRNSADRTTYDVVNGGVYASFVSGNVFANALAKYDYYWLNSRSPVANFSSRYHGKSYGAQGEVGIRFGSDSFYAEPIVSVAYVRTDLNSPNVTNATIDFDKLDGVRGKAGLRIGSAFEMGGNRAVVYASGNAVHEFKGRRGLQFTSNGSTFNYGNDRIGTYGEGKIGFNITTPGGVTGFVEGFGNYSDDYRGGGARAGLRIKF